MAGIRLTPLAVAAFLSLSAFLILSAFATAKGRSQPWHDSCAQFWQKEQWHELKALASNLDRLGKADPEVLLFGTLATRQLQQPKEAEHFTSRFLHTRSLNWSMEKMIAQQVVPDSFADKIRLYRTRGVLSLFGGIFVLNLLFLFQRPRSTIIAGILALSIGGCILLLI